MTSRGARRGVEMQRKNGNKATGVIFFWYYIVCLRGGIGGKKQLDMLYECRRFMWAKNKRHRE